MKSHTKRTTILASLLVFVLANMYGQSNWPVVLSGEGNSKISVYEPEAEQFGAGKLTARAAVSVRKKSGDEPVFGVMWFQAEVSTNAQSATIRSVSLDRSRFSDDDDESDALLKSAVGRQGALNGARLDISKINSSLEQEKQISDNGFRNDPPQIIYRDRPTTLIVMDGQPIEEMDDDLKMSRVMNTPYLIVKNPDDRKYYLYGGSFWYSSTQLMSDWSNVRKLPSRIASLDKTMKQQEKEAANDKQEVSKFTTPTDILVTTEPTEIIQTEGAASYKPVQGSTLLYVDNSLDEIFKDVESQLNYILISGRWYSSRGLAGPWTYVDADRLPASFANIPGGSEKDGVLANVAGTPEAEDAMMEARIPQTAKVDRNAVTCEVIYDGAPRFVPIENTNLAIAENSDLTVMLAPNNRYYALENGIWFISNSPDGPWQVANERPSDVDRIPPGNIAYNARYVNIYEVTPQYVYVGYTPGYMGTYIYRRTVVWGTGFRYRPWWGRRFYPRPYTWGFGMHYNPWTGWNISYGLSFNTGWYRYNRYHRGAGGWFGPPMYRPPYRPWGWSGGYYGNRPNRPAYRPNVVANRPPNWNSARPTRPVRSNINIYDNRRNIVTRDKVMRPVNRPTVTPDRPGTSRPGTARPGTERPGTTRPGTARPGTARPGTTRPGTERPTNPTERPDVRPERPSTGRPSTGREPIERPETGRPATGRPTAPVERPDVRPTTPVERPSNGRQPIERPVTRPTNPTAPVTRPVPDRSRPATPTNRPVERATPAPRQNTNRTPAQTRPANERPANSRNRDNK